MTLEEWAERIKEEWIRISETIEKFAEALRKAFEKIGERKRILRRPPKWYAKANNPAMIVSRSRAYHCRDKC